MARAGPGSELSTFAVESVWDGRELVIGRWARAPRGLPGLARRRTAAVAKGLPPSVAAQLAVEVAKVELPRRGVAGEFEAVVSGPRLIACAALGKATVKRWDGQCGTEALEDDVPIVLAPSAVHSIALHMIETAGGAVGGGLGGSLRWTRTRRAPFRPWAAATARLPPRVPGEVADLLFDPRRVARSPVVGRETARGHLWLSADRHAAAPRRALVLEGLEIGGLPGSAEISCRASWTFVSGRGRLAGAESLKLTVQPQAWLAGAAACGRRSTGFTRDPIEGDFWGWAPPLLLGSMLGDCA